MTLQVWMQNREKSPGYLKSGQTAHERPYRFSLPLFGSAGAHEPSPDEWTRFGFIHPLPVLQRLRPKLGWLLESAPGPYFERPGAGPPMSSALCAKSISGSSSNGKYLTDILQIFWKIV